MSEFKYGERLEVLGDRPFGAGVHKGDLVTYRRVNSVGYSRVADKAGDEWVIPNHELRSIQSFSAPQAVPTEVRVTSDSGGSKGDKLARFDQIPTDALWELAERYGSGNAKYPQANGLDNWRNGYPWSLSFAAAFRHMTAAMGGEDLDPDTGQKHVIAAAWHMFALAHWMNNDALREQYDDRQDKKEAAA